MKDRPIKLYVILNILLLILFCIIIGIIVGNWFSNTPKLHNIEKDVEKTIQIVVSRYNEDLKWTLDYPFNQYRYIVYNKNEDNDDYEKKHVIKNFTIKNQGKCDHTYLYHVAHHYDSLSDITIFFPGCLSDVTFKYMKAKMLLEYISTYNKAFFITDYYSSKGIMNEFYYFKVDNYKSMSKTNLSLNEDTAFRKSNIRPFGKWFEKNFNTDAHNISLFGIFSVDKRDILQHPKSRYYKLMKSLECDTCINDELSHYFEKSWEAVFFPFRHTCVVPYTNSISTIITKISSLYFNTYKDDYQLDLGSSPTSGPLYWNTIYIINKLTYMNLYANPNTYKQAKMRKY